MKLAERIIGFACAAVAAGMILLPPVSVDPTLGKDLAVEITALHSSGLIQEVVGLPKPRVRTHLGRAPRSSFAPFYAEIDDASGSRRLVRVAIQKGDAHHGIGDKRSGVVGEVLGKEWGGDKWILKTRPIPDEPALEYRSLLQAWGPLETREGILGVRYARCGVQLLLVAIAWPVLVVLIRRVPGRRG